MSHQPTRARTRALEKPSERTCVDGNQVIKTAIRELSPAVAAETSSFIVDTSLQLCPAAMRGRPDTPAATSLREYHFTVLMTQVASAYAEGRGQDFADSRSALDSLLREEPQHQPLSARFRRLMGLWLQDAHNKRQRQEFEAKQRRQREAEREAGVEKAMEDAEGDEQGGGSKSASPTAAAAAAAKSVFDLSGLIDSDEDDSTSDEDSSSDEK